MSKINNKFHFETSRILLRPITINDANDMYEYAKDPRVGPIAGWPSHTDLEMTKSSINNIILNPFPSQRHQQQPHINPYLSNENCPVFAIVWKGGQTDNDDDNNDDTNDDNTDLSCNSYKMIGTIGFKDTFSVERKDGYILNWVELLKEIKDTNNNDNNTPLSFEQINQLVFSAANDTLRYVDNIKQQYTKNISPIHVEDRTNNNNDKNNSKICNNDANNNKDNDEENTSTTSISKLCNVIEAGYALSPKFWGHGIVLEALQTLLEQFIYPQFRPSFVLIAVKTMNIPSGRVAEKVGAVKCLELKDAFTTFWDQVSYDGLVYTIPSYALLPPIDDNNKNDKAK